MAEHSIEKGTIPVTGRLVGVDEYFASADDIVPWLRQKAQWAEVDSDFAVGLIDLCKEAADEIERLRVEAVRWKGCQSLLTEAIEVIDTLKEENARQRTGKALLMLEEANKEIERLRNAGDALVGALDNGLMGTAVILMQDWREVRRS